MIAVVDYGAGNLYSVCNTLRYLGIPHEVTADPERLRGADGVILPGVGAFPEAMGKLRAAGWIDPLKKAAKEKPLLGICLGMQMLFEESDEFTRTEGLGLIPGRVSAIEAPGLKIPHMGWNQVEIVHPCALTAGMQGDEYVYFVHSFAAVTQERYISLRTWYAQEIPALVTDGGFVYGAQFHPEKSSAVGLRILKNFGELTGA